MRIRNIVLIIFFILTTTACTSTSVDFSKRYINGELVEETEECKHNGKIVPCEQFE